MATIQELKTQIENANALGRQNLAEKGLELPETATTYEIMQRIKDVLSGAPLNIAYGETAPEDTSKLWVKANESTNISVHSNIDSFERISETYKYIESKSDMGCARVGNKIYLFGGEISSDKTINRIQVFDTKTETITLLSTYLPTPNSNMACASIDNKIYLFGGSSNTINVFDTEAETISTLAITLPTSCSGMGCARVGNKIYLFGGYSNNYLNTINVFDTETGTISTLSTTLPNACAYMGCTVVGTKIYLFGGWGVNRLNTINVFDTKTETIVTLSTTLPTTCSSMGCESIGNKIYLFGGYTEGGPLNTINVFDTETETITTLSAKLPTACDSMGCASIGNKIYLFGGYGSSGRINTINVFVITHELTQSNIEIQSGLLKNKFNLINTDTAQIEIGIENVFIGNANNEAELCEAYLHNGTDWIQI